MVLANQNAKLTGPDQGFLVSRFVLTLKPWERGCMSSIQSGGSESGGAGGALNTTHDVIRISYRTITRACNVFKECGPNITSILRKFLQFNTLLIFIPTQRLDSRPQSVMGIERLIPRRGFKLYRSFIET